MHLNIAPHLMIHVLKILLLSTLFMTSANAQSVLHLEGLIETDPTSGLLRGDICLSRLPDQQTYIFLLNRGLNIREVRDIASGRALDFDGYYNAVSVGDAIRYRIEEEVGPKGFCVSYLGAFPVYEVDKGERSVNDWKGQIAFDGQTVRAADQTRFYPVIIDSASGTPIDAVSYRLSVVCRGCASIYLNGSAPAAGPKATFTSNLAFPLLLYAGDFPFKTVKDVHFVGAGVSAEDAALIQASMRDIADAHEKYLGIPYSGEPAYLTFASVSRDRQLGHSTWSFVTWPTVTMDGRIPFSVFIDSTGGKRSFSKDRKEFMSHEMAHYYFGTRYEPQGPLKWFLLESVATFMAFKARQTWYGDSTYNALLYNRYRKIAGEGPVIPLDEVEKASQIGEGYRYWLGPFLLAALENYIGEEILRKALSAFVYESPSEKINYTVFQERLIEAGASKVELENFKSDCLVQWIGKCCLATLFGKRKFSESHK